jgi:hypothetical protein
MLVKIPMAPIKKPVNDKAVMEPDLVISKNVKSFEEVSLRFLE